MQAGGTYRRPDRAGYREVQVGVELIEGVLQRRVVADPRPDLDRRSGRSLDEVAVAPDIGQVGISTHELDAAKQERADDQGQSKQRTHDLSDLFTLLLTWSTGPNPSQAETAPTGFATHSTRRMGEPRKTPPGFIVSEVDGW